MKLKELRVAVQQFLQEKKRDKKKKNDTTTVAATTTRSSSPPSNPIRSSKMEWKRLFQSALEDSSDVQVQGKLVKLKV
jgi:hypothetical protein